VRLMLHAAYFRMRQEDNNAQVPQQDSARQWVRSACMRVIGVHAESVAGDRAVPARAPHAHTHAGATDSAYNIMATLSHAEMNTPHIATR